MCYPPIAIAESNVVLLGVFLLAWFSNRRSGIGCTECCLCSGILKVADSGDSEFASKDLVLGILVTVEGISTGLSSGSCLVGVVD